MKDIFNSDERNVSNEVYQTINKLNNNGKNFFVTTNIDKGLQKYLGMTDAKVAIYPKFSNPPKFINYLHGRIDLENSWILTSGQYNQGYYYDNVPCMSFLTQIFESYSVLFIGYGLREKQIQEAISKTGKRKTHYWLEGWKRNTQDDLEIRRTNLKENYNITLISYSVDKNDFDELYEVVDLLYREMIK